jgi:16S rRNA (adenine(1408)-N(1))-methyltransferase
MDDVVVVYGRVRQALDAAQLRSLARSFQEVALDLGAGDGRFVYRMAQRCPRTLWIGVDPAPEALAEYSARAMRKPARGGLPAANALFLAATVEALPAALDGLAGSIYVHLPWGSLLRGLLLADPAILTPIARAAAPPARLHIYLNTTAFLERVPGELRELPPPTPEYCRAVMAPAYAALGITLVKCALLGRRELARLDSTWARRIAKARHPQALYLQGIIASGPSLLAAPRSL